MNVDSRHMNATMRFTDTARDVVMSLHRVRPNIDSPDASHLSEAIQQVRGHAIGGVSLTVTSELLVPED